MLLSAERVHVLEEIGHRLSQTSPDPEVLTGILELIASRVERPQMSIYLAGTDQFVLGASTGYDWATPKIELSRITSAVVHSRHPRMVPIMSTRRTSASHGIEQELCLPILEGGEPVGLLLVSSPDDRPVARSEYPFFEAVADRLAAAMTLDRDRRDLAARRQRFRRLSVFAATLAESTGPDGLQDSLASAAAEPVSASQARICVPTSEGGTWTIVSAYRSPTWVVGANVELDELELAALQDRRRKSSSDPANRQWGANALVCPIVRAGVAVGLLRLERAGAPFELIEQEAAALMADSLAVALDACHVVASAR